MTGAGESWPWGSCMMRPLAGLKVVEFEGIGPGPLAGRMLADLGADVVAIVRPDKAALGDPDRPFSDGPLRRGKRVVALDLKRAEAVVGGAGDDRDGRRADRGQSAGRDGAAQARPRRLRQAQSAARLRAHDRLGAGRPARARRGPRSQLSGAERRAVARRPRRAGADGAADGSRRRRRRARARLRGARGGFRGSAQRQGLRGRLLDRRHGGEPGRHRARGPRRRNAGRAKPVPRLAFLRRLRLRRRPAMSRSARSSRSSTPSSSTSSALRTSTRRRNTTAPPGRR